MEKPMRIPGSLWLISIGKPLRGTFFFWPDHSTGPFNWTIQVGHSTGPFDWTIQLGHSIGPFEWAIQLDHSIGPFDWTIRLDHSIGPFDWTIRLDHSTIENHRQIYSSFHRLFSSPKAWREKRSQCKSEKLKCIFNYFFQIKDRSKVDFFFPFSFVESVFSFQCLSLFRSDRISELYTEGDHFIPGLGRFSDTAGKSPHHPQRNDRGRRRRLFAGEFSLFFYGKWYSWDKRHGTSRRRHQ